MPYGQALLTAGMLALHAADQPILLGKNALADQGAGATAASEWSTAGIIAGASDTNASFPVRYGYDRRLDIPTKHTTSVATTHLIYDMGTDLIEFDSVVIAGHNLKGRTVTVTLMLSDDGDFTGTGSNVITLATWTNPTTSARLVSTTLDHIGASSRIYSSVRYVAIKLVDSGAHIAEIGQLWLAKRLQLEHQFKYPHPFKQRMTKKKTFRTDDDHATNVILADGAHPLPAVKTQITNTATQADLIDQTESFLDDVSWGGKDFIYIEQPTTLDQQAPLMNFRRNPTFPEVEAGVHMLAIDAIESSPLSNSET